MKSIQNQYIDLKEGRMSQAQFMRNVRLTMPHFVTNITSFNDAVKILKNKAILTESYSAQDIVKKYNEMFGRNPQTKFADVAKALNVSEDEVERAMMSVTPGGLGSLKLETEETNEGFYGWDDDQEETFIDAIMNQLENIYPDMSKEEFDAVELYLSKKTNQELETKYSSDVMNMADIANDIFDKAQKLYNNPDEYEEELNEAKKKKLTATEVDQSELRMGLKVEMEHTDDPKKAEKIALDHLAENPFYYTQLKLSGVDVKALPSKEKKAIAKKKDETELVDKANQMKTPKGVEKVKASANKAKKETNKLVKGVEELTHAAKRAKGVKGVMDPTGGKMKKIKETVEEKMMFQDEPADPEKYQIKRDLKGKIVQATNDEGNVFSMNDEAIAIDNGEKIKIAGFKEEQGKVKAQFKASTGMFFSSIDIDGLKPINKGFRPGVDLGSSFDKFKSQLKEVVLEVLSEMFDGRDDLNAHNDDISSVTEIKAGSIQVGQEFTLSDDLGNFKMGEKVIVDDVEEDGVDVRIVLVNDAGVKDEFYLDPNDDIELM